MTKLYMVGFINRRGPLTLPLAFPTLECIYKYSLKQALTPLGCFAG